MEIEIQHILAQTIIDLSNKPLQDMNSFYVYEKEKLKEPGALTNLEKIKKIFEMGVNPLTVVYVESNEPCILFNEIIKNSLGNSLVELTFNYLNKEQMAQLPNEQRNKILSSLVEKGEMKYIEQFFEKGFRLIPGQTENNAIECEIAQTGNLQFFEILKYYQPDFNLNHGYDEIGFNTKVTLLDLIEYDIDFETGKKKDMLINLQSFIKASNLHEKLQNEIELKSSEGSKLKI